MEGDTEKSTFWPENWAKIRIRAIWLKWPELDLNFLCWFEKRKISKLSPIFEALAQKRPKFPALVTKKGKCLNLAQFL